jgi:bacteriocin biosynthesis cyclodehydratase domain-containing protein
VRPALKAGLLPVWRDRDTVQIGIDPRRAIALTGLGDAALVLGLLDGSRDRGQVIEAARDRGVPEPVTERILTLLAAAGALDDFPVAAMRALPQERRARLGPELAAASLARGHSDAGAAALVRRDAARVQVYGPGRIAAGITDILATSGVGRIAVSAPPPQASPASRPGAGQALPKDPRDEHDASRSSRATQNPSAEPRRGTRPAEPRRGTRLPDRPGGGTGRLRKSPDAGQDRASLAPLPDLAILVGQHRPDLAAWLMRAGVAHLAVAADEAIGVVGPLVRPGRTACLRCLDLTRAALDPAWPLILAQLAGRAVVPSACDAALAGAVAAQAAAQALTFLDRVPRPGPAENGTLELVLPAWQWRRRTWRPHSSCDCAGPAPS